MYKVIINNCFGHFGLSKKAMLRLFELGYKDEWFKSEADLNYSLNWNLFIPDISRHNEKLIQVVEELGEEANGDCAKLDIEEIESPFYRIENYDDGLETLYTEDKIDWIDCRKE